MITELKLLIHGALYGNNKLDKLGTSTMMESRNPNIVRILEENLLICVNWRNTNANRILESLLWGDCFSFNYSNEKKVLLFIKKS